VTDPLGMTAPTQYRPVLHPLTEGEHHTPPEPSKGKEKVNPVVVFFRFSFLFLHGLAPRSTMDTTLDPHPLQPLRTGSSPLDSRLKRSDRPASTRLGGILEARCRVIPARPRLFFIREAVLTLSRVERSQELEEGAKEVAIDWLSSRPCSRSGWWEGAQRCCVGGR
jgi:hypothetical protein